MKSNRYLLLCLFLLLSGTAAWGQLSRMGLQGGGGLAFLSDEMYSTSPMLSVGGSAYLDWEISQKPGVNQFFSLRTGLGVARRGGGFGLHLPTINAHREGVLSLWSLQLPVLAHLRFLLPIQRSYKRQYVSFSAGPMFQYAVAGHLQDRQSCSFYESSLVNYNVSLSGKECFSHLRRIDMGLLLGLGYQYHNITADIIYEVGFVRQRNVEDGLIFVDRVEGAPANDVAPQNPQGHSGTFSTLSLRIGYQWPLHPHFTRHAIENPFKQ